MNKPTDTQIEKANRFLTQLASAPSEMAAVRMSRGLTKRERQALYRLLVELTGDRSDPTWPDRRDTAVVKFCLDFSE